MKLKKIVTASVALTNKCTKKYFSKMSTNLKPKVYVTRRLNKEALDILRETCEVTLWDSQDAVPRDELLKNVLGKQALLCLLTDKIDAELLDKATDLKVIATMSVGYDHLDLKAIKSHNIKVGYTPDVLTDSTAELTVALLLATSRRLIEASNAVRNGEWKTWSPFWMCGPGLANATIGIFGLGRIGQEVARRLKPFKVNRIIYTSRTNKLEADEIGAQRVDFETLCSQSDFIVVACALTSETKQIFSSKAFKLMKPTCVFINTSRGGVVDEEALIEALQNKTIGAAGLDVMVIEPLPLDSPLLKLDNCVVLPHIGSACLETRNLMARLSAQNIKAALQGQEMPAELKY